jgi:two-component system chemotaxis response regulator CheB
VLFRSAVDAYGPHVLAVVLTGMGQDGLRGCERVHEGGGQIFVQDEASSVIWGMPRFVVNAGLADKVLPLRQLGSAIMRSVAAHRPLWHDRSSVGSRVGHD